MASIFSGTRPDLTPAQVVGLLVAGVPILANILRAFGVYEVSHEQQQALQDTLTWGGVMAGALFAADAGVRAARNAADAKRDAAALSTPPDPGLVVAFDPPEDAVAMPTPPDAVDAIDAVDGQAPGGPRPLEATS
jgi:hypothetical protein